MSVKEDDLVLCTVKKIEGTTVFVELEDSKKQGTIMTSEIAAGRIRNLRDYVVPNKKIVCKILRIYPDHLELSLRRVTSGERNLIIDKHKKEKTLLNILRTVTKDAKKVIEKIKESLDIEEFIEEAKENKSLLSKFLPEPESEKLHKILSERRDTEKTVRSQITLSSQSEKGLLDIQEILDTKGLEIEINYLGSSQFEISATSNNFKEANNKIETALETIQKRALEKQANLELKEAKK